MDVFDPVRYSLEENKFFLGHLGESPVSALQEQLPDGVNPVVVQEVLGEIYSLEELKKHRDIEWAGTDAISKTIKRYLSEWELWREMSSRGAPRFPTMHAWDGKGRPHRGGISSDSSKVTTYIDNNGKRHPFTVHLRDSIGELFKAPWTKEDAPVPDELVIDNEHGTITCPVDKYVTNFKTESRQSFNMARTQMHRHCKTSKDDRVREFGMKVFG